MSAYTSAYLFPTVRMRTRRCAELKQRGPCKLKARTEQLHGGLYLGMARSLSEGWPAPKLREERGTRLPHLSLMHMGQTQPRCWGGYKRQSVHYTDEAIPGQRRGLFGGKGEGKCTIWKVLIAPGLNSNCFCCSVQELVWSQSRTTRNLISSAASMSSTKVNFMHLSVHF